MKINRLVKRALFFSLISFLFLTLSARAQVQRNDSGISALVNGVKINIQFYDDAIVRVVKSPEGGKISDRSYVVIKKAEKTKLKVQETGGEVRVQSERVSVALNLKDGKVSFLSKSGDALFAEKDNGTEFEPVQYASGNTFKVKQSFALDQDEKIYGLGQIQNGKLSQRNEKVRLANENMKITIPFFQSNKGYGLYWDSYAPVLFSDSENGTSFQSESGDKVDYYFLFGGNADGVIAQMRDLTGEVPMFPYWTFGYFQSKERYSSQEELLGVVKKYRELGVPLDGIVQDWQYWGVDNKNWNALEFGNPLFPDPQKMISDVHNLNAHIIISVWPSFGPETKPFKELDSKKMTFGFTTYPPKFGVKVFDVYNPEARNIVWKYMNDGIFKYGMDGWWLDATEPDLPGFKNEYYDAMTNDGLYRDVCNAFPLKTVEGVYNNQRKLTGDKRVFILTRSAFAGQQRYGATSWSGDITSSWKTLHDQVPAGLNFSLSGIPYWNSDIGGFFSANNYPKGVRSDSYRELYVRWLQFGTFCTLMRSHGTQTPREIYQFGNRGDWAFDAIEKYIRLRYRLLPYIYSASWEITSNASTLMRALVMDFGQDKEVLNIEDQFMFGKGIMVCPVVQAQYTEQNADAKSDFSVTKQRNVYLPGGTQWYDFWTNEKMNGGQRIVKKTPIDVIPLYIKAGTILPLASPVQYSSQSTDSLEIRIYPGSDGKYVLYDDEKDNYNYEKGAYSTIEFNWSDKEGKLTIGKRSGSYPGMPGNRVFKITVLNTASENKSAYKVKVIEYKGSKQVVSCQ